GDYNPFNLLVFDGQQLLGLESRHARLLRLEPGLGGVSNADFNSAWPKLDQLKSGLQTGLQRPAAPSTEWLDLLQSRTPVPDAQLPCTGVALEWERSLASTFVSTAVYGTRASSVVRIGSTQVEFVEQVFDANGPVSRQQIEFCLSP
ncbi:MAG: NRDE family protein, partial [Rhodoferax sp.]